MNELEEQQAAAEAAALEKTLARVTTEEGSGVRIVERVVHSGGGGGMPPMMLTRTNYTDWALITKVVLQADELWEVVDTGVGTPREDRRALVVFLRGVPPELTRTLATKATAKLTWDTLKTMRVGVERVREAKEQTRRSEYEGLRYKDGEGIESFIMWLSTIVNELEVLGDPVDEHKAVLKVLHSVPRPYRDMAVAIESLVDTKQLLLEELCGRLLVVEEREREEAPAPGGRLLLTEEEWMTH